MTVLAPTVSSALALDDRADAGWVEVCRGAGSSWIYIGSADAAKAFHPPGHASGHAMDHCPFCNLHTVHLGASTAPAPAALLELSHVSPELPARVLQARLAWYRALSRGPPVSI